MEDERLTNEEMVLMKKLLTNDVKTKKLIGIK